MSTKNSINVNFYNQKNLFLLISTIFILYKFTFGNIYCKYTFSETVSHNSLHSFMEIRTRFSCNYTFWNQSRTVQREYSPEKRFFRF